MLDTLKAALHELEALESLHTERWKQSQQNYETAKHEEYTAHAAMTETATLRESLAAYVLTLQLEAQA